MFLVTLEIYGLEEKQMVIRHRVNLHLCSGAEGNIATIDNVGILHAILMFIWVS